MQRRVLARPLPSGWADVRARAVGRWGRDGSAAGGRQGRGQQGRAASGWARPGQRRVQRRAEGHSAGTERRRGEGCSGSREARGFVLVRLVCELGFTLSFGPKIFAVPGQKHRAKGYLYLAIDDPTQLVKNSD